VDRRAFVTDAFVTDLGAVLAAPLAATAHGKRYDASCLAKHPGKCTPALELASSPRSQATAKPRAHADEDASDDDDDHGADEAVGVEHVDVS
jgi:hypothetical protein